MGGRHSPIIIVVLLIVVIIIGVVAFFLISPGKQSGNRGGKDDTIEKIAPVISLDKKVNDDGTVTIIATASTDDELGIDYIVLPDDSEEHKETVEYDVEENGDYTFAVVGLNGETKKISIEVTEIPEPSSTNPYMPDGFKYIGGEVDSGYVIGDDYGNQYVWVPVPNGKLTRNTELNINYDESNEAAAALVNSVAKYYGFYIARFEASEYELNGGKVAASMSGKVPWTNIDCKDATDYSVASGVEFGYSDDVHTSLINSYAWDTTVAWIEEEYPGYSTSTEYGNYEGTIYPTGVTESDRLKGICDLSGNVREWTTEKYSTRDNSTNNEDNIPYRVVRGGSANLNRTPISHIGYLENTSDFYWGFRLILYK